MEIAKIPKMRGTEEMKEAYEAPTAGIIAASPADIITTSDPHKSDMPWSGFGS